MLRSLTPWTRPLPPPTLVLLLHPYQLLQSHLETLLLGLLVPCLPLLPLPGCQMLLLQLLLHPRLPPIGTAIAAPTGTASDLHLSLMVHTW